MLRPPAWDLSKVLTYLVSPAFEPLSQASFCALTLKTLFLLALATAKRVGELQALFRRHLCGWGCLTFLHPAVCRQVGVAHPFHPSLLLCDVLSRLCGWSCYRPPTMPCQGSPLVSASGQIFVSRSPSPFRVPRRPARPLSKNAVSFFLREVISAAGATRPQVGSLWAHEVRSVSTSVAFHRNWSVTFVLESATGASSSVFFFILSPTVIKNKFEALGSDKPESRSGKNCLKVHKIDAEVYHPPQQNKKGSKIKDKPKISRPLTNKESVKESHAKRIKHK